MLVECTRQHELMSEQRQFLSGLRRIQEVSLLGNCTMITVFARGGGGGGEGNFGTGVRPSFLKPTPIIYLVLEKNYLFIYLPLNKMFTYSYTVL